MQRPDGVERDQDKTRGVFERKRPDSRATADEQPDLQTSSG